MKELFRRFGKFAGRNSAFMVLLVLVLYGAIGVRWFLTQGNMSAILYQYSIMGLLALGQFLVILTGGIDLSQGALIALTSITTASAMSSFGLVGGALAGIAMGTTIGFLNGFLVSRTNMQPFLVTLGMMGIARGLALQIANAKPVPIENEAFMKFGEANLAGVPASAFIWIAACVLAWYGLKHRRYGRYIYAVGSSEENTRLAGVNVARIKLLVYVFSAFLTSIGGVIWTARLGSGSPIGGSNYELESIASVVVGGASLSGGFGKVGSLVAGVLVFGVINSILNLSGISPFWQGMVKGLIIIVAITLRQAGSTVSGSESRSS